jgi:hypothetical protein
MKNVLILIAVIISAAFVLSCSSGSDGVYVPAGPPDVGMLGYSGGYVDVNGDGHEDLVLGAPGTNRGQGAAFAFYGSASGISNSASWSMLGENSGDTFGHSFAVLGDVDGDGEDDFAIGAIHAEGASPKSGVVYVYRGGSAPPELLATLEGELTLDKFGYKVAGGDLNADGLSEVIVSAVYATGDLYQSGAVYIYNGGADIDSTPDAVIHGHKANGGTGYGLETGDINSDGVDDLFVGGGHSVDIFHGGTDFFANLGTPAMANATINGGTGIRHSGHGFGDNILYLGDLDGDAVGDLLVSNWRRSRHDLPDYKGSAYIFNSLGTLSGAIREYDATHKIANIVGLDRTQLFGSALALTADVDSGGKPDLLMGSMWATGGISNTTKASGKVYLFSTEGLMSGGGLYNTGHAIGNYTVDSMSGEFGHVLAAGPYGDFFAGAPRLDGEEGSAYVINASTADTIVIGVAQTGGN